MKRILLFTALISVSLSALAQVEFTGEGDGYSWDDPDNWSGYSVPQDGDDVYISGFYVDRYDSGGETYGSLQLESAHLDTQGSLILWGDLYVDEGSTIYIYVDQLTEYSQIYCDVYYFNGTLDMRFFGYAPRIGDNLEIIHGLQGSCGSQTVVYVPEDQASGMEVTFGVQCQTYGINYTVTDINYASAISWDGGGGDNNWANAANWDPNVVPTAEDNVYINHPTGGYVNTPAGGVTVVESIIVGRDNTLAINGNLSVNDHIYNNTDANVIWNAGEIKKSEDDYQSLLLNYGHLILDSPGLKSLDNGFEIWSWWEDINHNQGNLNINNGRIYLSNGVNYNINGDNITIGYSSGTNHTFKNVYSSTIKKTSGTGTSSINLTNLENGSDIICEEGTLVFGEGVIQLGNSNFGGNGSIQFPLDFVLDSKISPGSSPGILTIVDDLTTTTNATFNIEIDGPIAGTDYDRLVIENNADISANLNIVLGYLPANDAVFEIVTSGALIADNLPETIETAYNGNPIIFNVIVQNNSIYLSQGGTISTATLNGSVAWNSACGDRDATIKLYQPGTATQVASYDVSIQSNGSFSIPEIEIGTFDVIVKVDGYLAKGIRDVEIAAGDNSLSVGSIINGNINKDGAVNITDFSLFAPAFSSVVGDANYNPLADLNCNGAVNITDFSIFVTGFSRVGDTAPLPPLVAQ